MLLCQVQKSRRTEWPFNGERQQFLLLLFSALWNPNNESEYVWEADRCVQDFVKD